MHGQLNMGTSMSLLIKEINILQAKRDIKYDINNTTPDSTPKPIKFKRT
jgi:hypothetical protein